MSSSNPMRALCASEPKIREDTKSVLGSAVVSWGIMRRELQNDE